MEVAFLSVKDSDLLAIYKLVFASRLEYQKDCMGRCCCDCEHADYCLRIIEIEKIIKRHCGQEKIDLTRKEVFEEEKSKPKEIKMKPVKMILKGLKMKTKQESED